MTYLWTTEYSSGPSYRCGVPTCGVWRIDSTRAQRAGLRCRPLEETVADTWEWLRTGGTPVEHPRWAEHGISVAKETEILAKVTG